MLRTFKRKFKNSPDYNKHNEVLRVLSHEKVSSNPNKLQTYISNGMLDNIKENLPTKKIWVHKFHSGKEEINHWLSRQPNRGNIRHARYEGAGIGGIIGIQYEEVDKVIPADESNDWRKFCQESSEGISKTGQLLLQKAVEAYVYCVLGAQAQTRWKIVGAGAKSLQTQEIFRKLVRDTVAQDDDTVLISNLRTAIKTTNVILNLAIMPGLILIPSDLLILKEKIAGYNNTITLATKNMNFGVNEEVNFNPSSQRGAPDPSSKTQERTADDTQGGPNFGPPPKIDRNKQLGVVFTALSVLGAIGVWLW